MHEDDSGAAVAHSMKSHEAPATGQTVEERGPESGDLPTLVVGMGGSAGAFEALKHVLSRLPAKSGMAYLVVKHLDTRSALELADSLSQHCRIPVQLATDGMLVERDKIYVAGMGTQLSLSRGLLRVTPQSDGEVHGEIDLLFTSLAEARGSDAVGILLSGLGSDGVAGMRAIRSHDGLTLAQSPETALYDMMPESTIAAGVVDLVLPVEDMPAALLRHLSNRRHARSRELTALLDHTRARLPAIATVLLRATGHDFARYKEGTLTRRVQRRIDLLQLGSVDEYLEVLGGDTGEAELLFKDLLIGVSQFFRDPEAFEALADRVIPRILDGRDADVPVRIWVPGCASGEEAYSLAMLVREKLVARGIDRLVQVFATDIDVGMLALARRGRFPLEIEQHVSPDRLERFFIRDAHGFEVRSAVREMTIFSVHNLVRDPPFSSLDLISCRNLLIYLKSELQRKLVPMFHYALRPGGFLFLGPSEGMSAHPELFAAVDKRYRIFRRNDAAQAPPLDLPHVRHRAAWGRTMSAPEHPPAAPNPLAVRTFERLVLEEFAPATIAIDERGEILFIAGRTSRYLQPPAGGLSHNLFDHVRRALRRDIRVAVEQVARTSKKVVRDPVRVEIDGEAHLVTVMVRPLPATPPHGARYAVVIQEVQQAPAPAGPMSSTNEPVIEQLEAELNATRAELQAAVEELESANEELRSSNEELVSANEEMQSANEEMQTSREELQSANEELETLNTDLHEKAAALSEANDDLQNLLAATQIATIFLDSQLRITKYTPAARSVFHLIDADVGRSLEDLAPKVEVADLLEDCRRALAQTEPIERQVRTVDGARWYSARFLPYRRVDGAIDGVVVTFVDITALKTTEESLRVQRAAASQRVAEFDAIFDAMAFPIIVFDALGRPVRVNHQTRDIFGIAEKATDAASYQQLGRDLRIRNLDGLPVAPDERASSRALRGETVHDQLMIVEDPLRGDRIAELTAIPIDGGGAVLGWRDVTEKLEAERALREQQRLLEDVIDGSPSPIFIKDLEGRFITVNRAVEDLIGMTRSEVCGKTDQLFSGVGDVRGFADHDREVLETGRPVQREHRLVRRDGTQVAHLVNKFLLRDSTGKPYGVCGIAFDITDRKAAEEQRLALERQVLHAQKLESLGVLAGGIAHDFNNLLLAILGNLDLAYGETLEGSPMRSNIEGSMQAARRAADLSHQMLAFAGKGAFLLTHVDLCRLVNDNAELIRASIPKNIELELRPLQVTACVEADAGQMQQLILNLMTNAAEAIGDRPGRVVLAAGVATFEADALRGNRTEPPLAAGSYAYVDVADTGCGMDAATLDRLFDPFFSTRGAGRGLGMAAMLGIVRSHHGAILVDSEKGRGTRVRVLFPPCKTEHAAGASATVASPGQRKGRVLVVDDEEAIRLVCSRIVQRLGHDTMTAKDGVEAVQVFKEHHDDISCVILDMSMPRMGGIAALEKMRGIDATVPVILSSGFSEQQLAEVAHDGDLAGFVTKPYDIQTLSRVLEGALKRPHRS